MPKLYSTKSNAKRAAARALGPEAVEGVGYRLTRKGGRWTWSTVGATDTVAAGAKSAPKPNAAAKTATKPHTRDNTKQARLIEMLRRPEGATLEQIVKATGWQPHTVRGAIAGALKRKLGLTVESKKVEGRRRVYRVVDAA